MEDITPIVHAIDNNRTFLTALMQKLHDEMGHALIQNISIVPEGERDHSLFLLLVQNYVAGFLTSECNPPAEFVDAVRFFYAKGMEHGHAYLEVRKENQQ